MVTLFMYEFDLHEGDPMLRKSEYTLVRSKRKTVSVSVTREGEVVVRAPLRMPAGAIEDFLSRHSVWIERSRAQALSAAAQRGTLSQEEKDRLSERARAELPGMTLKMAEEMGVSPTGVRITSAQTRWGSCSAKNTICFSYRVMLLPQPLIEYVIVHELAHIREKNHGAGFYRVLGAFMPDHRERERAIRELTPQLPL